MVDLGGRLVTPAFVDAHVHLAATGFAALGADLSSARSADEALDLLAAHAAASGLSVVLGHGWDETGWPGGRPITRRQLDEAVGARPAYVSRVDVHSAVASTALLDAAALARRRRCRTLDGWSDDGPLTRDAHHAVRDAMNAPAHRRRPREPRSGWRCSTAAARRHRRGARDRRPAHLADAATST